MRWPTVEYDGPATQDAYNQFSFDRFAYSDIASLYFRNGLLLRIGGCILEQARIELP